MSDALDTLGLDHVRFCVGDPAAAAAELVTLYGFQIAARDRHTVALTQGEIGIAVTGPAGDDDPAAAYVLAHGDGVADIALRTADAAQAYEHAVAHGARPVHPPQRRAGCTVAAIAAFGDVVHSLIERPAGDTGRWPPGLEPVPPPPGPAGLAKLDHFAVCLPAGDLAPTVEFYETALRFRQIFAEHIVVGDQAMNSEVVQNAAGDVTLTLIEPDTAGQPGQIDQFVKNHGGPGVQHVAMLTPDIVHAVSTLRDLGVGFLVSPDAYYDRLPGRLAPQAHTVGELHDLSVLADSDHDGQLFQIFTRSIHPRRTFFFEVIERRGATTFGSGNIKALYEAVEAEGNG